jgi:SAM-dependent methyltransferase
LSLAYRVNRLLRVLGYQVVRADTLDRLAAAGASSWAQRPAGHGVAYSCVIDQDPVLIAQCFIWLNCLIEIHAVPCCDIFVHTPDGVAPAFVAWLRQRAVNVVPIQPFDRRNLYCNKICQLETFATGQYAQVILMDCDTAWIGERPLPLGAPASAKIVDLPNPPEAVLRRVFHTSGLGEPDWVELDLAPGPQTPQTDHNNCNGGLYILDGRFVAELGPLWIKWAHWSLDRAELFEQFSAHADQVSFALAMRELGARVAHQPIEWNYPTHLPAALLPDVSPQILHYHRHLTEHCRLLPVGQAGPDRAIAALNQHITEFLAAGFLNDVFWDFRYRFAPDLGSGIGSRGDLLTAKRQLLAAALTGFEDRPVLDVGCGDLEVTRALPLRRYIGLDVSREAVRIGQEKRPDWQFMHDADSRRPLPEADAVICLDVLIHQRDAGDFDALLQRLIACTRQRLIVSGYDAPPSLTSEIVGFHRPLQQALRDSGAFAEITVIGCYRDLSLIVASKPPAAGGHSSRDRK